MAHLDEATFSPYLKQRNDPKCSDVSKKLFVHVIKTVELSLSGS